MESEKYGGRILTFYMHMCYNFSLTTQAPNTLLTNSPTLDSLMSPMQLEYILTLVMSPLLVEHLDIVT